MRLLCAAFDGPCSTTSHQSDDFLPACCPSLPDLQATGSGPSQKAAAPGAFYSREGSGRLDRRLSGGGQQVEEDVRDKVLLVPEHSCKGTAGATHTAWTVLLLFDGHNRAVCLPACLCAPAPLSTTASPSWSHPLMHSLLAPCRFALASSRPWSLQSQKQGATAPQRRAQ